MARAPSPSPHWPALAALALLCLSAAVLLRGDRFAADDRISKAPTRRAEESGELRTKHPMGGRSMVGGYSSMDAELLRSEEVAEIANFALNQHAAGASPFGDAAAFLAVTPVEAEGGGVRAKVLEAQRQVVAGLNYKLTIALLRNNVCLGAFKVTVYKPLPHMEQGLTVTNWGAALGCGEIVDLMEAVAAEEEEEGTALRVERERKEEQEGAEPSS